MPWPPITGLHLIDAGLEEWLIALNNIIGVETLQSCSGNHPGASTPGSALVWLAGNYGDHLCRMIYGITGVDAVSVLYGREDFPVTEVRFFRSIPSGASAELLGMLKGQSAISQALNPIRVERHQTQATYTPPEAQLK